MLQQRQLVRAVMGRADAWQSSGARAPVSVLRSLADIIRIDLVTVKRLLRLNRAERRAERALQVPPPRSAPRTAAAAAASHVMVLGIAAAMGLFAAAPALAQRAPQAAVEVGGAATPNAAGVRAESLSFRDLRVRSAIRLQGTHGEIGIPFGIRENDVVTGATLTLTMAWSPALLGDLSQLVVLLNGEVVRTIPLTSDGSGGRRFNLQVDPALFLPGDNQLNLRLLGHYTRDCEDPFHSSLWANISNLRSGFELTVQRLPFDPDLARLPAPFFDRNDNLALELPFVFAGPPNNAELEAAASMASWFGGLASYRGFAFKPFYGRIPAGDAIVFVRPGMRIGAAVPEIAGPSTAIVRNPNDPFGQLLLIMGRNERELKLAAASIATGRGVLGGTRAGFDGARIPSYPRYGAPRWLRMDRPVRLGEIVDPTSLQGQGLPPGPLTASFRAAPDLFFWPRDGATLNLKYRYPTANWLDRRASRLDVSINNLYLRTLPLVGEQWWQRMVGISPGVGSNRSDRSLSLPGYNLFGQNELIFDYNLIIANKQRCEGTLPENVRVAIDPNSTIDLTRAYHAKRMPDLASFANAGYPFTVSPDLNETVALIGANPSPAVVEAFLGLIGRFGDSTGAAATALTVTQTLDPEQLAGRDILAVGGVGITSTALFADAPVRGEGGRFQVIERNPVERLFGLVAPYGTSDPDEANSFLTSTDRFNGFVSFQSPYDSGRTVVAMLASDGADLPAIVQSLNDQKVNEQVQGDLSVADGEGMRSFAVSSVYWNGNLPVWMRVAWWFSQRPLLMALGGVLVALFLAGPLYLLLRRQQRRRLNQGISA